MTAPLTIPAPGSPERVRLDQLAEQYMARPYYPEGALKAFINEHRLDRGDFLNALERWRDARRSKL